MNSAILPIKATYIKSSNYCPKARATMYYLFCSSLSNNRSRSSVEGHAGYTHVQARTVVMDAGVDLG